ncbi:copper resistance D family protein [Gordonia phosphorivorans]|uniref:Copper resistance D family protein n=1 Tax=Gordonia phosphorivorans TaxID=1056982 RepID=A0ABV6H6M0_9ACTN
MTPKSVAAGGAARTGRVLAVVVAGVLVGLVLCAALAGPDGPLSSAWPGGIALAAGCLLVGLGALSLVGAEPVHSVIAGVAGCWGAASLITAWLQVAERAGRSPMRVGFGDVTLGVQTGLAALICVGGAIVVLAWVYRPFAPPTLVAVVAGIGVFAVATTGHAAVSLWPQLLVGVHAVLAAWWAGTLAAMALTVRGRGGWARALPEFSRLALPAVGVLVATGVGAAALQLGVGADWWQTGYGRVVLAKAAGLAVLLVLAAVARRTWVPAASRHRTDEAVSLRRAVVEVALLTVLLGLAAGLATTAPGL